MWRGKSGRAPFTFVAMGFGLRVKGRAFARGPPHRLHAEMFSTCNNLCAAGPSVRSQQAQGPEFSKGSAVLTQAHTMSYR